MGLEWDCSIRKIMNWLITFFPSENYRISGDAVGIDGILLATAATFNGIESKVELGMELIDFCWSEMFPGTKLSNVFAKLSGISSDNIELTLVALEGSSVLMS